MANFEGITGFAGFSSAPDAAGIFAMGGGPQLESGGAGLTGTLPFAAPSGPQATGLATPTARGGTAPILPLTLGAMLGTAWGLPGVADFLATLGADGDTPTEVFLASTEDDLTSALNDTVVEDLPLTGMQKAALIIQIRGVFERSGFEAPRLGTVARRGPPLMPPPPVPQTLALAPPAARTPEPELEADLVVLAQIVDQTSKIQTRRFTYAELANLRATYVQVCGAAPPDEHLPSMEQLAGLAALLRTSRPPYVDFAVWSPLGPRLARFRKSEAAVLIGGAFVTKLIDAPPDFDAWEESYLLFSVAMVTLSAATPGTMNGYLTGIKKLLRLFPGRWTQIAGADLVVRSERWGRMREELEATAPVDSPAPWDRVIALSSFGTPGASESWWNLNLLLPLTVGAPLEHAGLPGRPPSSSSTGPRPPPAAASRPPKRKAQNQNHSGSGGGGQRTDKAKEICRMYNLKIGGCAGEGPCPNSRLHVCQVCPGGVRHRAVDEHPDFKDARPDGPRRHGDHKGKRPQKGRGKGSGQ